MNKPLLIGLGNPILGDDGIGWRVVEWVEAQRLDRLNDHLYVPPAECDYLSLGGLSLMERLIGYQDVIIVDAVVTGDHPLGKVHDFTLAALPDRAAGHTTAAHDTSLQTALLVGRTMGAETPEASEIIIVGIESRNVFDFSETLTPAVKRAIPLAGKIVLKHLAEIAGQR